jgi:hypothetical protein
MIKLEYEKEALLALRDVDKVWSSEVEAADRMRANHLARAQVYATLALVEATKQLLEGTDRV